MNFATKANAMVKQKTEESRSKIDARCQTCNHVWTVIYLPLQLDKVASALQRATCPECGETEDLRVKEPQ